MKKIRAIAVVSLLFVLLTFALTGCSHTFKNTNEIPATTVYFAEKDGKAYLVTSQYGKWLDIDFENKTFSVASEDIVDTAIEGDKNSFFFTSDWDPYIDIDGYEALDNYIMTCAIDDYSIIDAHGKIRDNVMVGFIRVYKRGVGPYIGNTSVADVVYSYIYSYSPERGDFIIEHTLNDVAIIAFEGESVIYWRDRAFYLYNLNTKEEKYLVEHKSYDGGYTNWSTTEAIYDSERCYVLMRKGYSNRDDRYLFVYEWNSGELCEYAFKE